MRDSGKIMMQQTPVHDIHNPDILKFMPPDLRRVVEVGCSSGALAKAYKAVNPACEYIGLEIDADYAELSRRHCTQVLCGSIERLEDREFEALFPSDCWIFADVLEHLYDPWQVLRRIRSRLGEGGHIIACIPNAQHWGVQARLNCGLFRYEDMGLMDRTHIRWFTRTTMIELFQTTGYRIVEGMPRILPNDQPSEAHRAAIMAMAKATGADPDVAVNDAVPFQWVIKAVPA